MTINCEKNENTIIISPVGRLDSASGDEFENFISTNFTEKFETLVLDFSGVDFISSKGLRVVVSVYKKLDGRKLKITGANTSVKEVFRISGLLKIFEFD